MNELIDTRVDIVMRKNSGVSDIYGATVEEADAVGILASYDWNGVARESFIPWSSIGRLGIKEVAA